MSGEALSGKKGYGIDTEIAQSIASEIESIHTAGIEIAIVIGGGNIFRGVAAASKGFDRVSSDTVGMLATLMNSLVFKEYLQNIGVETRVLLHLKLKMQQNSTYRREQ
jgi:uridylate kinase